MHSNDSCVLVNQSVIFNLFPEFYPFDLIQNFLFYIVYVYLTKLKSLSHSNFHKLVAMLGCHIILQETLHPNILTEIIIFLLQQFSSVGCL